MVEPQPGNGPWHYFKRKYEAIRAGHGRGVRAAQKYERENPTTPEQLVARREFLLVTAGVLTGAGTDFALRPTRVNTERADAFTTFAGLLRQYTRLPGYYETEFLIERDKIKGLFAHLSDTNEETGVESSSYMLWVPHHPTEPAFIPGEVPAIQMIVNTVNPGTKAEVSTIDINARFAATEGEEITIIEPGATQNATDELWVPTGLRLRPTNFVIWDPPKRATLKDDQMIGHISNVVRDRRVNPGTDWMDWWTYSREWNDELTGFSTHSNDNDQGHTFDANVDDAGGISLYITNHRPVEQSLTARIFESTVGAVGVSRTRHVAHRRLADRAKLGSEVAT